MTQRLGEPLRSQRSHFQISVPGSFLWRPSLIKAAPLASLSRTLLCLSSPPPDIPLSSLPAYSLSLLLLCVPHEGRDLVSLLYP